MLPLADSGFVGPGTGALGTFDPGEVLVLDSPPVFGGGVGGGWSFSPVIIQNLFWPRTMGPLRSGFIAFPRSALPAFFASIFFLLFFYSVLFRSRI